MSVNNNDQKINIDEESTNEIPSNENIKQPKDLKQESMISSTKELIKKLIKESMNNSLTKLELNSENQYITLNSITKNSRNFQTKISKLLEEIDENLKKKEKEKQKQKSKIKAKENFKNSKKMAATQSNFRSRNNKNLLEYKTKKLNKNKEKDINIKSTTGFNTLNNSKIIDEKPKKNNKIQNISNKTQQNFRHNYKTGPSTPTRKKEKKIEIIKNKNSHIEEKEKEEKYKTLTNKVNNNKTRKIISDEKSHKFKKSISKSFSTNPLENNTEKIEKKTIIKINRTKTKFNNLKKDIKGALFKNIKKEFVGLEKTLNVIEEKDEKNDKIDKNKEKKEKKIPPDKKIKQQEETIQKQKEKISKLSEELRKNIYSQIMNMNY